MMNFEQNFFNACMRLAKETDEFPNSKDLLDHFGLDGDFLLGSANEVLNRVGTEQRLALGLLLGIFYERECNRNSD